MSQYRYVCFIKLVHLCARQCLYEAYVPFDTYLTVSVTRLGDLLHLRQLFKACGNKYFPKITHILGNFSKGVKLFHVSREIMFWQLS